MISVKVAKDYTWYGKLEDYTGDLNDYNPRYDDWKETEYIVDHKGYGYASFINSEDQKNCIDTYKT